MIKKVAILANGGDVSGFNAVIRAIIKTAENNNVECYGFIDGYRGLLENNYVQLCLPLLTLFNTSLMKSLLRS